MGTVAEVTAFHHDGSRALNYGGTNIVRAEVFKN